MARSLDLASSLAVTVARAGLGGRVGRLGARPAQPLELYEFESCPFCRKVREALSILDLRALVRPSPKGGQRFRPAVRQRGGRAMFPYLVDPNTGIEMYESEDILAYLFDRYGDGRVPLPLALGPLNTAGSLLAGLARAGAGTVARASRAPAEPLELYSFEASPFCRLVRERLCVLELPYFLTNVARGSPSRDAFVARSGRMMVPWLRDPNTGTELFESRDIVAYLDRTWALERAGEAVSAA